MHMFKWHTDRFDLKIDHKVLLLSFIVSLYVSLSVIKAGGGGSVSLRNFKIHVNVTKILFLTVVGKIILNENCSIQLEEHTKEKNYTSTASVYYCSRCEVSK